MPPIKGLPRVKHEEQEGLFRFGRSLLNDEKITHTEKRVRTEFDKAFNELKKLIEKHYGQEKNPKIDLQLLNQMGKQSLLEFCQILGVEMTRLVKGGITCQLFSNQLRTKIRQQIGRGTFRDREERLSFFLEDWEPSDL